MHAPCVSTPSLFLHGIYSRMDYLSEDRAPRDTRVDAPTSGHLFTYFSGTQALSGQRETAGRGGLRSTGTGAGASEQVHLSCSGKRQRFLRAPTQEAPGKGQLGAWRKTTRSHKRKRMNSDGTTHTRKQHTPLLRKQNPTQDFRGCFWYNPCLMTFLTMFHSLCVDYNIIKPLKNIL